MILIYNNAMKIVVAMDSFKGCLDSEEACLAVSSGLHDGLPESEVIIIPIADGGEGTGKILTGYLNRKDGIRVIELAQGAGLNMAGENGDVWTGSTYRVGEMIREAINEGCKEITVTLGGSGTNDAGLGLLQALGLKIYDYDGLELGKMCAGRLKDICRFDTHELEKLTSGISFSYLYDGDIPFTGSGGAVMLYAEQKGMTDVNDRLAVDRDMERLSHLIADQTGRDPRMAYGAGAAGGTGGGLFSFLNAKPSRGIDAVLSAADFDEKVKGAAMVITGEGKTDRQTCQGKAAAGILQHSRDAGVPIAVMSGRIEDKEILRRFGFDRLIGINDGYSKDEDPKQRATALARLQSAARKLAMQIRSGIIFNPYHPESL